VLGDFDLTIKWLVLVFKVYEPFIYLIVIARRWRIRIRTIFRKREMEI